MIRSPSPTRRRRAPSCCRYSGAASAGSEYRGLWRQKRIARTCSPPTRPRPRRLDLGDDMAVFDPVAAGIGDHGFQRLRAILVGPRHGAVFRGHQRQPAALRRRNLNALGMLAIDRRARLGRLIFIHDGDEPPGADDPSPELGVVHCRHSAVQPPSRISAAPVISEEASDARNTVGASSFSRRVGWPDPSGQVEGLVRVRRSSCCSVLWPGKRACRRPCFTQTRTWRLLRAAGSRACPGSNR